MKKLVVLENLDETPKISLAKATRYFGIRSREFGTRWLVFIDQSTGKPYTLKNGANFIVASTSDNMEAFVKYHNKLNFEVFCFDSQKEQFDWLTEV